MEKRFWILTEFYNICPNPKNLCFAMSDGRCYIFLGFANISFITYIMGYRRKVYTKEYKNKKKCLRSVSETNFFIRFSCLKGFYHEHEM